MTRQELIECGYVPESCKVGTLYFKHPFFCRLDDDVAKFFYQKMDLRSVGNAKTKKELYQLEQNYYSNKLEELKSKINIIASIIKAYQSLLND